MSGGDEFREIRTEFYNMGHASATWPVSLLASRCGLLPKRLGPLDIWVGKQCVTASFIFF